MKVVKHKETGEILYRSEPEFEKGFGIKNASIGEGVPETELEEVNITQQEWDEHVAVAVEPSEKERIEALEAEVKYLRELVESN